MPPTKRIARRPEPEDEYDEEPAEPVEEDEAATPRMRQPAKSGHPELRGGWTASDQVMQSTSSWAQAFIPQEKAEVIKFLDDEPYVGYRRHWVERTGANNVKVT